MKVLCIHVSCSQHEELHRGIAKDGYRILLAIGGVVFWHLSRPCYGTIALWMCFFLAHVLVLRKVDLPKSKIGIDLC